MSKWRISNRIVCALFNCNNYGGVFFLRVKSNANIIAIIITIVIIIIIIGIIIIIIGIIIITMGIIITMVVAGVGLRVRALSVAPSVEQPSLTSYQYCLCCYNTLQCLL